MGRKKNKGLTKRQKRLRKQAKKKQPAQQEAKAPQKRSKLWVWGLSGLAALAITGTSIYAYYASRASRPQYEMNSKPESVPNRELSFLEAKANEAYRETYIKQVVKKNPPPIRDLLVVYDNKSDYHPNPLVESGAMIMRTKFIAPSNYRGVAQKLRTTIYRGSFKGLQSEDEFLSMLVDHEYRHVEIFAGGKIEMESDVLREFQRRVLNLNGDLFEVYHDLQAYTAQIKAFKKRANLRESFKREILHSYHVYRREVEEKPQTPLTRFLLREFPKISKY
ncbi:hypothetical protein KY360_02615 [Candidatus Woesearchaeota archaeon]|nr:hypothetical protein [Candidatus Woesearchaeota archaeon]